MSEANMTPSPEPTRRKFIQNSTAAVAGAALISQAMSTAVYAAGKDEIKVGLVGCGGRGGGATVNALHADPSARLVALGDLFQDKAELKLKELKLSDAADQIDPKIELFSGWDAYKQVIAASDVVLLATTPHFRPMHLKACIEAGKHIFCEKPVGVDAKSVKEVMDLAAAAKQKNLNLVSGLCYRYDKFVRATVEEIHNGRIGDIVSLNSNYLTGWLWNNARKPEWSDMEYQIRNWLYYTWLSGDHVVEQHIHSLDKALWVMKDVPPTRVTSTGGRQQRTAPEFGNIYDHFGNVFEWDMGAGHIVRCFSYCRQFTGQPAVATDVSDWVFGTEGIANLDQHKITGKSPWKKPATTPENMYDSEHKALFGAIRSGTPLNNGDYMCKATLMGIMARESAYSGKTITWDEILNSKQDLSPATGFKWDKLPVQPVAVPNEYKFE
jgi:myo-inositol 2-dehydrogenase/D-chiro-inositol 1-dehydrogenase